MFPASTHNFFKKWKISTFSELASWLCADQLLANFLGSAFLFCGRLYLSRLVVLTKSTQSVIIDSSQVLALFCWFSVVLHWGFMVWFRNGCGIKLVKKKKRLLKARGKLRVELLFTAGIRVQGRNWVSMISFQTSQFKIYQHRGLPRHLECWPTQETLKQLN